MATPKQESATYADIEALPPNVVGEILFGSLVTRPRPTRRHGAATMRLGSVLGPPFDFGSGGPGGWIFIIEPELHLGPHVVVPNLAGWRREKLEGKEEGAYFDEVPDWICEVLSPSTELYDRGDKRNIYASFEVPILWFIDPRSRVLELYQRQGLNWLLSHTVTGSGPVSAPPFDAISFSLGLLWPFDPPADSNS